MAEKILVLASSGSGKSTSLRNLDPETTVCIQVLKKRLPFAEAKNWKLWDKETASGSRIGLSNIPAIKKFMTKAAETGKKVIVIDDLVYLMADKVMNDVHINGFEKWTILAKEIYDLLKFPDSLPEDVRVYFLTHTDEDANGNIKMKTAGKLLDNLVTPEGMFTIVLGAEYSSKKYLFKTNKDKNNEPFKSPMDMFSEKLIDNDLKFVDDTICDYYGIE